QAADPRLHCRCIRRDGQRCRWRKDARQGGRCAGRILRVSTETVTFPDLRPDFPGLVTAAGEPWHYLDTAATSQKPQVVIDAVARALGPDYATVHRGVYARSAEMTLAYEAARRRVAEFVGGQEDEIVFTRGATEAINLVAYSWPERGRVLLSQLEHHSN